MASGRSSGRKILRMLCAMVFLSLGLAPHAPLSAAARPELAESYRLPDGTFASLCAEHLGEHPDDRPHPAASFACEVCLLAASLLLPTPASESWLLKPAASLFNGPVEQAAISGGLSIPQARSRAPPVLT